MKILVYLVTICTAALILINSIGGAMWDMADSMPLWWEDESEPEERDY